MAYASWSVVYGETPSASKWNILGTNDASFNDGTGIADGAILPKALTTGTGSSWVWQSWTPSFTNITVGSGTLTGHYLQVGKIVYCRFSFVLGSGSSVGTNPTVTLPVTARAYTQRTQIGLVDIEDSGTANYYGMISKGSSTTVADINAINAAGTYAARGGITSTTPMTWTTGDWITAQFMYEAG